MSLKLLLSAAAMMSIFSFTACDKDDDDDDDDNTVTFQGTMNGTNETPPNAATATGAVTGAFDPDTKILVLNMTYTPLTGAVTAWHIHKGAVGVKGDPINGQTFGSLSASPFQWTSIALHDTTVAHLMANNLYVNIHTEANPAGEIRGQLTKQ